MRKRGFLAWPETGLNSICGVLNIRESESFSLWDFYTANMHGHVPVETDILWKKSCVASRDSGTGSLLRFQVSRLARRALWIHERCECESQGAGASFPCVPHNSKPDAGSRERWWQHRQKCDISTFPPQDTLKCRFHNTATALCPTELDACLSQNFTSPPCSGMGEDPILWSTSSLLGIGCQYFPCTINNSWI